MVFQSFYSCKLKKNDVELKKKLCMELQDLSEEFSLKFWITNHNFFESATNSYSHFFQIKKFGFFVDTLIFCFLEREKYVYITL